MAQGYFRVYRDTTESQDIHFEQIVLNAGDVIPDDQLELRDSIDSALTTIRLLFGQNNDRFERYFRPLLSLAQLGLVGTSANPMLANRALASLKSEIVAREGSAIKNGYMKKLGGWALVLATAALTAATGMQFISGSENSVVPYLFMWSGCMAGVWLSFGARKVSVEFEDLAILEKDRLSPPIRLIFAGLLTLIIGLLVATGAVTLELGGLSTKAFSSDTRIALLLGALCGISELALSSKVSQHAKEVLALK